MEQSELCDADSVSGIAWAGVGVRRAMRDADDRLTADPHPLDHAVDLTATWPPPLRLRPKLGINVHPKVVVRRDKRVVVPAIGTNARAMRSELKVAVASEAREEWVQPAPRPSSPAHDGHQMARAQVLSRSDKRATAGEVERPKDGAPTASVSPRVHATPPTHRPLARRERARRQRREGLQIGRGAERRHVADRLDALATSQRLRPAPRILRRARRRGGIQSGRQGRQVRVLARLEIVAAKRLPRRLPRPRRKLGGGGGAAMAVDPTVVAVARYID